MVKLNKNFLFTSESVGEGHPDKICDQISDAILDEFIKVDRSARVAVETVVKTGMVLLFGEVTSKAKIDYYKVVRGVIKDIGYDCCSKGFDYKTCNILLCVEEQSSDISNAIFNDNLDDIGAGDQGIMFGYATDETEERIPLSLLLAHKINMKLAELRKSNEIEWLSPDSKSQVTIEYTNENGVLIPLRVDNIVVSAQHKESIKLEEIKNEILNKVIMAVVPHKYLKETVFHIQPSGKFIIGGPAGDSGLTGRKIIVDTYGGFGCHGGGCFSGKDWTKVDRSASYAARWVAKSLVDSGVCKRVLIQLSYAIGLSKPLSIYVDSYGTSEYTDDEIIKIINDNFDLRPGVIAKELNLNMPIYKKTAAYGHFGRKGFPWEKSKVLRLE